MATDRDVSFANESFLIGVLQLVSGGSVVGALSQFEPLLKLVGKIPLMLFISVMVLTLVTAVLAAYWKHEYKKWDLKSLAAKTKGETERAANHARSANSDLDKMRWAMQVAVAGVVVGYGCVVLGMWLREF